MHVRACDVGTSVEAGKELGALELFAEVDSAHVVSLARQLEPLWARTGEVLMRQGEHATSFLIITSGGGEVRHAGRGGAAVAEVSAGVVVGEIALLRNSRRTATVVALDNLHGYIGQKPAFATMLAVPYIAEKLVRTARQRVAAFVNPVPIQLKDGRQLQLRPVLPGDLARIAQGRMRFSPETLRRRFMSVGTPTRAMLAYLSEVDYVDHFAWVVTDGVDGPVVADARYVRDRDDPTLAEIAFTVADAYQGCGLGTQLFASLAAAAQIEGIERFHAYVLEDNAPARALLNRLAMKWLRYEPGVVETNFDVPALNDLAAVMKAQELQRIYDTSHQVIHAFEQPPSLHPN